MMSNKILKRDSYVSLYLVLLTIILYCLFAFIDVIFLKDSIVQTSYRRQKNVSPSPPAYSREIQAKHGMKVALFLAGLDISPRAKAYVTSVLNRAGEAWNLEQAEILVRLWYDPAFSDEVLQALCEIADIKGCRNFIYKLTSSYPAGAVKQILNAAMLKEEGKTLTCVETPIVGPEGQDLTDIDIGLVSEDGSNIVIEIKSLNDIIRSNGTNRNMRLEELVEDFYTAPHSPSRINHYDGYVFSKKIGEKIANFKRAFNTLSPEERPEKIIFRISFDCISRPDKRRVKNEIIRVVSKDIKEKMRILGIDSEYEVEVEVVELEDYFSTHLFYEHYGNIAVRLEEENIDTETSIQTAKTSVFALTGPRQEQLTQLLNLGDEISSPKLKMLGELLLDYIDRQNVNYESDSSIPNWIATNFPSITILRQYLLEFSKTNLSNGSEKSNNLRNKFFRFMDGKLG